MNTEMFEKRFQEVFRNAIPLRWDTEVNNTMRAQRYGITANTNSIKLYDVPMAFIDEEGTVHEFQGDVLEMSLLYKQEHCESLKRTLRPMIDYSVKLVVKSDDQEYVRRYNLKHFKYQLRQYDNCRIYMIDEKEKINSMLLLIKNEVDRQYLHVFMYIITENNLFDEARKDLERKELDRNVTAPVYTSGINIGNNNFGSLFSMNTAISSSPSLGMSQVCDPYKELENLTGLETVYCKIKM